MSGGVGTSVKKGAARRFNPEREGFWCFTKFATARRPEHVMLWSGIDHHWLRGEVDVPLPDAGFNDDLMALDAVTEGFSFCRVERLFSWCDREVRAVAGLDYDEQSLRWRAVVARAYWEAWRVAEGHACAIWSLDRLAALLVSIEKGCPSLFDNLEKAEQLLENVSCNNEARRQSVADGLQAGRRAASDVVDRIQRSVGQRVGAGSYPEVGRQFFAGRLAEVFALLTGNVPPFHWSDKTRDPTGWFAFLAAAERLVGLSRGRSPQGYDGLMKGIERRWSLKSRVEDCAGLSETTESPFMYFTDDGRLRTNKWSINRLWSIAIMGECRVKPSSFWLGEAVEGEWL